MIVVVTGGRDYNKRETVFKTLDWVNLSDTITTVRQGGANGADRLGLDWARVNGVRVETFKAMWDAHGLAAGPIRNRQMLEQHPAPDLVIAFPGGKGTNNCVDTAHELGVSVYDFRYNNPVD